MTTEWATAIDPQLLRMSGAIFLVGAVVILLAIGGAAVTASRQIGVCIGTGVAAGCYLLVTHVGVPIAVISLPAFGLSTLVIAGASLTALVRLSRAEL